MVFTRLEKEQLVLDLHNQGKGTREIAQEVKISFGQIGAILNRAAQQREAWTNPSRTNICIHTSLQSLFTR
jgi:DNA invertase Pin-like site-specific DNA recombinase